MLETIEKSTSARQQHLKLMTLLALVYIWAGTNFAQIRKFP